MYHSPAFISLLCLCYTGIDSVLSTGMTASEVAQFSASGSYQASVTVETQTNTYKISSTGMPDHATQKVNPNNPEVQNHVIIIPKSPTVKTTKGCLPMGKIGLTKTGVSIYNPLAQGYVNAVEGKNQETFDSCDGHPTNIGDYHYHKLPDSCLWKNLTDELIGVAADGFPIYGPNITGYPDLLTTKDLDQCHGMEINGRYRYIATYTFPYILACFHGGIEDKSIRVDYVCKNTSEFDDPWGYLCSCHEYSSSATVTRMSQVYVFALIVAFVLLR